MEHTDSIQNLAEQLIQENQESAQIVDPGQAVQQSADNIVQEGLAQFIQFDAEQFLTLALVLILIYLLLNLFDAFLASGTIFGRMHGRVQRWVHNLYLIYEPIALLLVGVSLVLINPLFFGLLIFVVLLAGVGHLRNYFSGLLVQFDNGIQEGKQIKTGAHQGVISNISRLGLRLKTGKGLEFVNYQQLISNGYVLSTGDDLGRFYRLTISTRDTSKNINGSKLKDLLTGTPYLDWNHQTAIVPNYEFANHVETRVLVREEHHLQDLLALINEWGYQCKVSKK